MKEFIHDAANVIHPSAAKEETRAGIKKGAQKVKLGAKKQAQDLKKGIQKGAKTELLNPEGERLEGTKKVSPDEYHRYLK